MTQLIWNNSTERLVSWNLGWGLLSQRLALRYFPDFSALSKHKLAVGISHLYLTGVAQLNCGDISQI